MFSPLCRSRNIAEFKCKRDFLDEVDEATKKGKLMNCGDLIQGLLLCRRANLQIRVDALFGQVRIAKEMERKEWLKCVSKDALDFQFIQQGLDF